MTEIGLTKSERRYYEIGYDAGFKQSRLETIREVEGKIEVLLSQKRSALCFENSKSPHDIHPTESAVRVLEEIKQILTQMKE